MKRYYMALDHCGQTHHLKTKFPRKELLEIYDRKHAEKMYIDSKQGPIHTGYVIAGCWINVYRVQPFKAA